MVRPGAAYTRFEFRDRPRRIPSVSETLLCGARTMGLPQSREARLYYRGGKQRFEDAQFLLREGRTTGAVYLAGYTVECFLKALILASVAPGLRQQLLEEFRGSRAHSIEWLGALYRRHLGAAIPRG